MITYLLLSTDMTLVVVGKTYKCSYGFSILYEIFQASSFNYTQTDGEYLVTTIRFVSPEDITNRVSTYVVPFPPRPGRGLRLPGLCRVSRRGPSAGP